MKHYNIIDGKINIYEGELEKIQKFVSKKGGDIIYGFWQKAVEEGKKKITNVWFITREGICVYPLEHIFLDSI